MPSSCNCDRDGTHSLPLVGLASDVGVGRHAVIVSAAQSLAALGMQTCRRLHQLRYPEGGGPKLGMCMSLYLFRPAGRAAPLLAVGYEAGHVALWDTSRTLAPLAVTRLHEEPVLSLFADAQGSGAVTAILWWRQLAHVDSSLLTT